MSELNILLEQDLQDDKFMTLFYGELDLKTLTLSYANAGHESPLLYRKATGEFEELESTGIPLGMMDDSEYEENQIRMQLGDILVLSTDGISEAMNKKGEQFGIERLVEIIRRGVNKSANQVIKDCHDAVLKFCGEEQQRDDLTLVVLKFTRRA